MTFVKSQVSPFEGWARNLVIENDAMELIVTLDVGPRILSYRLLNRNEENPSPNLLKIFQSQMGKSGEFAWQSRGGHRLWFAPEERDFTYTPDNVAVEYQESSPGVFSISNPPVPPWNIRKEMRIHASPSGAGVKIEHRATHEGKLPVHLAIWALTVMTPGGFAIVPNPPLGEHPRDLLPERSLVLWPYTDLTDPRLTLGSRFHRIQQAARSPLKIGANHRSGWMAYVHDSHLFTKTVDFQNDANYPDLGCNLEIYTDAEILELETLGGMRFLQPGETISHTEKWNLQKIPTEIDLNSCSEASLTDNLNPLLKTAGLSTL